MTRRDPFVLSRAGDPLDGCFVTKGVIAPNATETTKFFWVLGILVLLSHDLYAWSKIIQACLFID